MAENIDITSIFATRAVVLEPTCRLRWKRTDHGNMLQQWWRDVNGGAGEWKAIEVYDARDDA